MFVPLFARWPFTLLCRHYVFLCLLFTGALASTKSRTLNVGAENARVSVAEAGTYTEAPRCMVTVESVQLVYFPPVETSSTVGFSQGGDQESTLVSNGYTFTSPTVYAIYHSVDMRTWGPDKADAATITIGYDESAVSVNYCNFQGDAMGHALDWRRLNVTELAHPYPNSELSSRFGCSNIDVTNTGKKMMQSPLISLPLALTEYNSEWANCNVEIHATDPPRPLTWVPEEAFSAEALPPPPPPPPPTTQEAGWATPVPAPTNSPVPDPLPTMTADNASPPQDPPKDKPRPRPVDISPAKADDNAHTVSEASPSPNPDLGRLEGDATSSNPPTPESEPKLTSVNAKPGAGNSPAGPVHQNEKVSSTTTSDPEKEDRASGISSTSLPEPVPGDRPSPSAASPSEAAATHLPQDANHAGDGATDSSPNNGAGVTSLGEQHAADGPHPKQIQDYTGTTSSSSGDAHGNTKNDKSTFTGSEQSEDTIPAPAEGDDTSSNNDSSAPGSEQSKDTALAPANDEDPDSNRSDTPSSQQNKDTTIDANTNNNNSNATSPEEPKDPALPSDADTYTNAANSAPPFSNATSQPSTSATFSDDLIPTLSSNPDPDALTPTGPGGVAPDTQPDDAVVGQNAENAAVRKGGGGGGGGLGLCLGPLAVVAVVVCGM